MNEIGSPSSSKRIRVSGYVIFAVESPASASWSCILDGLELTERWLRRTLADLKRQREEKERHSEDAKRHAAATATIPETPDTEEAPPVPHMSSPTPNAQAVLTAAYWSLLDISAGELSSEEFPEVSEFSASGCV